MKPEIERVKNIPVAEGRMARKGDIPARMLADEKYEQQKREQLLQDRKELEADTSIPAKNRESRLAKMDTVLNTDPEDSIMWSVGNSFVYLLKVLHEIAEELEEIENRLDKLEGR